MNKVLLLIISILCFCFLPLYAKTNGADVNSDIVLKNKLFSISLPRDVKGTYSIKKSKNCISVYHKESRKLGFGGFAFGIKAYRNPSEHATLPGSKKLGELTDIKGNIYDIVIKYPTDVQFDYTKGSEAPSSYKKLYDLGEKVNIEGINGSTYSKNKGTLGNDLYSEIIEKHKLAINEKWDFTKLEKENMSYMYSYVPKDKVGYIYYDVNGDGIEELFFGEITKGSVQGVIYDIYTMVNRKPQHVVSGGSRNRYFVCDYSFICKEYSSGTNESGVRVYHLVENSTELFPQVSFKYDYNENSQNPYFVMYSYDKWENYSKKEYEKRKKVFEQYERFNYMPLQ